ncbi:MAG TPA: hypothetical protein VMM56_16545 [Planctomycetaceae bacterium]|nr:hypothetical protein [Planctomycetaceae bacterium]
MVIRRFWKWAAIGMLATTVCIVAIDLRDASQIESAGKFPLKAGAAHLESISPGSTFPDEVFDSQGSEVAFLEELSDEPGSFDLLNDEQRPNSAEAQTERSRPNELPPLDSVPAIPLLSPDQRRANIDAIRKVYPEATEEQIEFWLEETRGLPSEMIREMLRLRKQIGPLTEAFEPKLLKQTPATILPQEESVRTLHAAREIVLQNLAHSETVSYLRTEVQFVDGLDEQGRRTLKIANRTLAPEPGKIVETGESLDIAMTQSHFLQVVHNGQKYVTRYGHLRIGSVSELQLAIEGTEIAVTPGIAIDASGKEIRISRQGEVQAREDESAEWKTVGMLPVVEIANPQFLIPAGNALYTPTERSGNPRHVDFEDGLAVVRPGAFELSNVDWDREEQLLKRLDWLIEQYTR